MPTPTAKLDSARTSESSASTPRRAWYKDRAIQILLALLLGAVVGYVRPQSADSLKPLGDLFIKLVRMLVAPIIFCTVVHGIASVGEAKKVGRVAVKALIYFEVVTTIGLILGLLLVNLWAPGAAMHVDPRTLADSGVKAPSWGSLATARLRSTSSKSRPSPCRLAPRLCNSRTVASAEAASLLRIASARA
jgi:Na+/H+-dicarboxylate symporter